MDGDFVTAPEISQMFGEMIGLCLAQTWLNQGAPAPFALAELGPGRGTLMADLLRAAARVPGFCDAARLWLVEASPVLRDRQQQTLAGQTVTWCDTAGDLPQMPLFLVANEFFDALPIRQFLHDKTQWRERLVGLGAQGLTFGLGAAAPQPALASRLVDTADGDLVEICSAASPVAEAVGARIDRHGGAALIIDYGAWRSLGDTLQALRGHAGVDPLATPGQADLTAHVAFEPLARAAPCAHTALTPQGVFLERLGITARAQALARGSEAGSVAASVAAAYRRLTHPDEMGQLFQVLGLYPAAAAPPPGLTA